MKNRPMYWSVWRELWESRSIYLAPLIVTAVVLFATLISTISLPRRMRNLPADPAKRHVAIVKHFNMAPAPIMATTFLVAIFYSLDALYSERRDRSILFWKSLPVSDLTTVLSKASIPFFVLPMIGLALVLTTQRILLFVSSWVLLTRGINPAALWAEFRYPQEALVMIYGLTVHVLWFAPMYGWLMLLSAGVRRAPFLWAVLPPFALSAGERIVFGSSYISSLLKYRFMGAMAEAFAPYKPNSAGIIDRFDQLTPARFLTAPGLWIGLALAAIFLAAAVRLRRYREPI